MGPVDDPPIGAAQRLDIVHAVDVDAPQGIHAAALVKAAPHAHAFVGQGKYGFAHPGIAGVEAFLYDLPGIHPEIDIRCFCHGDSFLVEK